MRPTPIPTSEIWPGTQRMVIGPPGGDLTREDIAPVEALVEAIPPGIPRFSVRCVLEEGDLDKLAAGGTVWLSFYGGITPFALHVAAPETP